MILKSIKYKFNCYKNSLFFISHYLNCRNEGSSWLFSSCSISPTLWSSKLLIYFHASLSNFISYWISTSIQKEFIILILSSKLLKSADSSYFFHFSFIFICKSPTRDFRTLLGSPTIRSQENNAFSLCSLLNCRLRAHFSFSCEDGGLAVSQNLWILAHLLHYYSTFFLCQHSCLNSFISISISEFLRGSPNCWPKFLCYCLIYLVISSALIIIFLPEF